MADNCAKKIGQWVPAFADPGQVSCLLEYFISNRLSFLAKHVLTAALLPFFYVRTGSTCRLLALLRRVIRRRKSRKRAVKLRALQRWMLWRHWEASSMRRRLARTRTNPCTAIAGAMHVCITHRDFVSLFCDVPKRVSFKF
jgi:hypothetical protein